MKTVKRAALVFYLFAMAGCSVKGGQFRDETNFSFPNSNVTPLGSVKSTMSRWSFLTTPIGEADALLLLKDAIGQKAGADLVINYTLDTKVTVFPLFIYKTDMVLEGTAAKMEVGEQDLRSVLDQIEYRGAE